MSSFTSVYNRKKNKTKMKSILLVSLLFGIAHAVVPLYKQCGGWNYSGDKDCGSGYNKSL